MLCLRSIADGCGEVRHYLLARLAAGFFRRPQGRHPSEAKGAPQARGQSPCRTEDGGHPEAAVRGEGVEAGSQSMTLSLAWIAGSGGVGRLLSSRVRRGGLLWRGGRLRRCRGGYSGGRLRSRAVVES